jgi:hypothetical protein
VYNFFDGEKKIPVRFEVINMCDVVAAADEACTGGDTEVEPSAKRLKV